MISPPALVLASSSPRRRQLLAEHGYFVEVFSVPVEESSAPWLSVRELVLLNAGRKAAATAPERPGALVLGADTLVCLDGQALGKPRDLAQAHEMLLSLSGREHLVFTGVCLMRIQGGASRTVTFVEQTRVTFRSLSETEIRRYHALIDPLDKAGAYAAQEHPELVIAAVDGSRSNVLGLPMERLGAVLEAHFQVRALF